MSLVTMKPPAALRSMISRSYATRLPQRPPARVPDPLIDSKVVHQHVSNELTFIHRPPPSAPTPLSYTTAPVSPLLQPRSGVTTTGLMPPRLGKPEPERMSDEALAEMQRLRREDPTKWTTASLARKFECTQTFVMMKAPLKMQLRKQKLREREAEHEKAKKRWGEKRSLIRDIQHKRRSLW